MQSSQGTIKVGVIFGIMLVRLVMAEMFVDGSVIKGQKGRVSYFRQCQKSVDPYTSTSHLIFVKLFSATYPK